MTLEKILISFLGKEAAEEIMRFGENNFSPPPSSLPTYSDENKEQLNTDFNSYYKKVSKIDFLITYTEDKLDKENLIKLLLEIGENIITQGEMPAAVFIFEKIINQCDNHSEFTNQKAAASFFLAEIFSRQSLWHLSFDYLAAAENIFKSINDTKGFARCQNLRGTIYGECGKLNEAKFHFEKALSVLESDTSQDLVGMIEINLGIINNIQGNLDNALLYYKRALIVFVQLKDLKRISEIKHNLGMLYTKKTDYTSALSQFDESIKTSRGINYLPILGISYLSKAFVYAQLADYELAEAFSNKALEICTKVNDRLSVADIYKIKGIIQRKLKNFSESEKYLQTSLRINRELENKLNQAETSMELGLLYKETDKDEESRLLLKAALEYFENINAKKEVEEIQEHLL